MEEALRLSEELFRSAMHHSPIGMAILTLDGKWKELNPALCNIVGYSIEELLQRDYQSITHPDDLAADAEYVRRLLSREVESSHLEKRDIRKDGSIVWVEINVSLVKDAEDRPTYYVCQIQDVTERRSDRRACCGEQGAGILFVFSLA